MRAWVAEHLGFFLFLVLGTCGLLCMGLLAWAIMAGSFVGSMIAGCIMAVIITVGGSLSQIPDNMRTQATERTLRLASDTLVHMRGGLTAENCQAVCQLLLPETRATAISMTDDEYTLAYIGGSAFDIETGQPVSDQTQEVLDTARMQTFTDVSRGNWVTWARIPFRQRHRAEKLKASIIAPLVVKDRTVGTIKLYYRHGSEIDRTQLAIARGLAELLSTQLSSHELDRQAELTARAEVRALQAQINPHFLFNTLNTIAAFTRINPTQARDLLREFSVFYRRTLENSDAPITLASELEQTRRYLKIEKARFGEDRIVENEQVEEGCENVLVPSFLVQPIVENAVRHAMRDEGPLHIDVMVATDGDDVLISVADDGMGMTEEAAATLLDGHAREKREGTGGTGMALANVAERVEMFFGKGSGVEIMSRQNEGTCVTLRLANAACRAEDGLNA